MDGGIPTFCRGWGHLPFNRSNPELTAHELLAWDAWRDRLLPDLKIKVEQAIGRGANWLICATEKGSLFHPSPIELYFAKLWYSEELYPLVAAVGALDQITRIVE